MSFGGIKESDSRLYVDTTLMLSIQQHLERSAVLLTEQFVAPVSANIYDEPLAIFAVRG